MKKFFEGGYARYVLPGVLVQSMLIGGGYATGRVSSHTAQNMEQWDGSQDLRSVSDLHCLHFWPMKFVVSIKCMIIRIISNR